MQINRLNLIILFSILFLSELFSQSIFPYHFDCKKDMAIVSLGVGLNTFGFVKAASTKPSSVDYLNALNASDISLGIDRNAVGFWSTNSAKLSDDLLYTALVVPATLALSSRCRDIRQGGGVALMGLEALMLSAGLTNTVKNTVRRPRPYAYNANVPMEIRMGKDARRSFFSGHTSTSAAATFFTAQVFSDLYPESRWRYVVWSGAATLPLIVGVQRYKAGKHFPTDIAVGYLVGAVSGILVPRLHKK